MPVVKDVGIGFSGEPEISEVHNNELFDVAAEIYVAGHRDGVRHAVAEIAPEAERHGFRLWLPSELDEAAEGP